MAQLIVRNIEDSIAERLKQRAAANGVSAEEEHRRILRRALSSQSTDFRELLMALPAVGDDSDFARIPQPDRPIDL